MVLPFLKRLNMSNRKSLVTMESSSIRAVADASIEAVGASRFSASNTMAFGGVLALNHVINHSVVQLQGGSATATVGGVHVRASNAASVRADNRSSIASTSVGGSIVVAMNTVGYDVSSMSLESIDLFLGTSFTTPTPSATSSIDGTQVSAGGGVSIFANKKNRFVAFEPL